MHWLRNGLFLLASTLVLVESAFADSATALRIDLLKERYEQTDDTDVMIVAHRGCWAAAPENSVASIEACIRLGVEAVEIDVQMSLDRELIVFHDQTLNRMTSTWGYVADKPVSELQELALYERDGLPVLGHFQPLETMHKISTLRQLFEAARGNIMINLEIKASHRHTFEEVFQAAAALSLEMGVEDHVFWKIPSGLRRDGDEDTPADLLVRKLNLDGLPYVMPMIWQDERSFLDQVDDYARHSVNAYEVTGFELEYLPKDESGQILGAQENKLMAIAIAARWSDGMSDDIALADPDAAWGKLIDLGFGLIMTDRPEQLISYLEAKGLR